MLVEVCANSLQSALNAEKAGADRIELCSELAVGGITPSFGLLQAVRDKISIPVRVLIRPRSGDFTYSEDEINIMIKDITLCREMGFDGVVSGVLNTDFTLNTDTCERLIEKAKNLEFTFHRAFDWVSNPIQALAKLENIGVGTILSSGQQKKAINGLDVLTKLQDNSKNIVIMPGSGIKPDNAHLFKEKGFSAIHLSGIQIQQTLAKKPVVGMNSSKLLMDDALFISQIDIIQKVKKAVK